MVLSTMMQKDPVIVTSADVAIGEALGSGQFGKVFKGFWKRKTYKGEQVSLIRDHSFSTYAKFSGKLTFLTPHIRTLK